MKIAVMLPSRGLIFSQTADEILQNLKAIPHKFFFSHRKPIPDCFEDPTNRALSDDSITHLWFIEDDMVLRPDILQRLIETDKAVVTIDYPVNSNGRGSIFKVDRQVVFCGTGCILVKREVFDELRAPYFRTDMRWNIKNYGTHLKMIRSQTGDLDGYGLHDVNFCMNLYHLGIPIHALPGRIGQRKLNSLGKAGSNNGAHNIETWTKVVSNHLLREVKRWPVQETGNLVTVVTPTGEISVSQNHARTLIKQGLATKAPRRKLVVDWGAE